MFRNAQITGVAGVALYDRVHITKGRFKGRTGCVMSVKKDPVLVQFDDERAFHQEEFYVSDLELIPWPRDEKKHRIKFHEELFLRPLRGLRGGTMLALETRKNTRIAVFDCTHVTDPNEYFGFYDELVAIRPDRSPRASGFAVYDRVLVVKGKYAGRTGMVQAPSDDPMEVIFDDIKETQIVNVGWKDCHIIPWPMDEHEGRVKGIGSLFIDFLDEKKLKIKIEY